MPPRLFVYKSDGDLATIGKRAAVIDFGWTSMTGWIVWWIGASPISVFSSDCGTVWPSPSDGCGLTSP